MRNLELDIVKCIAIYLVVLGHLLDLIGDLAAGLNLCHIAAFFFVSGYLLFGSLERNDVNTLLIKKTRNLLVPYIVWSSVAYLANMGLYFLENGNIQQGFVISEFVDIFLQARSAWFLVQLLFAYYVFLLCKKVTRDKRWFWIINIIVYALLCILLPDKLLHFYLFKRLYIFFIAGYAIALSPCLQEKSKKQPFSGVLTVLACSYPVMVLVFVNMGLYEQMTVHLYASALGILIGADGVLLIIKLSEVICHTRMGTHLAEIGQYSIDIYVIHMFLIKFIPIQGILNKFGVEIYIVLILYAAIIVLLIWFVAKKVLRHSKLYCLSIGR